MAKQPALHSTPRFQQQSNTRNSILSPLKEVIECLLDRIPGILSCLLQSFLSTKGGIRQLFERSKRISALVGDHVLHFFPRGLPCFFVHETIPSWSPLVGYKSLVAVGVRTNGVSDGILISLPPIVHLGIHTWGKILLDGCLSSSK